MANPNPSPNPSPNPNPSPSPNPNPNPNPNQVGYSSQLGHPKDDGGKPDRAAASDAMVGVLMTLAGTFVQSVQYTYEEKVIP